MTFNLDALQQIAERTLHNADEFVRKYTDFFVAPPGNTTFQYYDKNGNLVTVTRPNLAKLEKTINDFVANAKNTYPFINILKNPWMLDIDGDGKLESPLTGHTAGDYSIIENKVFAWNDSSLPNIVKQALGEIGAVHTKTPCNNPCQCCIVPFNVQKFKISGSSYDSGHFHFMPGNSIKGKFSAGALAVVSTTGNIKVEGLGELEPNKIYKFVVFRNGEYRNWNIDFPWIRVQGTADIWIIGPWVVPGVFTDSPGENKGHPLFVAPNAAFYLSETK